MDRKEKAEIVSELGAKLQTVKVALLARYQGLTVVQTNQFRREIRNAKGECRVMKNTLARRALQGTPYGIAERWLEGQTAMVLGYEDPVAVAKIVARWAESEGEKFSIKGGVLEGQMLEPASVSALAKTPSKEVLRAQLLGLLLGSPQKLVRLLAEPAARLARLLNSRKDKLEPEGGSAA